MDTFNFVVIDGRRANGLLTWHADCEAHRSHRIALTRFVTQPNPRFVRNYLGLGVLTKKKHSTTSPELIGAGVSAREIVMDNVIDDDVPSSGNVPSRCPEPFSPFYWWETKGFRSVGSYFFSGDRNKIVHKDSGRSETKPVARSGKERALEPKKRSWRIVSKSVGPRKKTGARGVGQGRVGWWKKVRSSP